MVSLIHQPVNCGATVPRVSLENFKEDNMIGLYCSRIGSTLVLISSDAAYNTQFRDTISTNTYKTKISKTELQNSNNSIDLVNIGPDLCKMLV